MKMNDLQLFGLQYLGKSADVDKILHTNKYVFILENGELFMRDIEAKTDFEKIAPDRVFNAISLDNMHTNVLCVAEKKRLHFYDYKIHKLASYTLTTEYVNCAWSPSNELVALVTKEGKLKTFSFNPDGITLLERGENYISNNNPQHCYMNLSWDFRAMDIQDKLLDPCPNSKDCIVDDSGPMLAWRGTGTMFVVNYYVANKYNRFFKIYSNDCTYLFEGVQVAGLQSAVAWKPGLSFYLTMPIARKNKMMIGLFEKTGSLNDTFSLRDNLFVTKIDWSTDGQVLGVLQRDVGRTPLSLYFYKNKQWFLKQYLTFEDSYSVKTFHWLLSSDSLMYPICVLTNENIYKYVFKKGYYVTSGRKSDHHIAAYATVDGNKLDLTMFVENVLLLSSGMFQKDLPKPINHILFHPTCPKLVIMDCDTTLYLCEYSLDGISIIRRYEWDDLKKLPFMLHHMYWGVDDYLYCVGLNKMNPKSDKLFVGDLKTGSSGEVYFLPINDIQTDLTYVGYAHNSNITVEQRYTEVGLRLDKNSALSSNVDFKVVPIKVDAIEIENVHYIIALTRIYELYINFQKVMSSVTSFYIHNNYLILTKQPSSLLCIRLKDDGIKKLLTQTLPLEEIYSIPIELDTILITGIPNTPEIVLQVSKQKFETIRMKPIIIDSVEEEIEKGNWQEAYNILLNESMDLNILPDLDIYRFVDNIGRMTDSLKSQRYLNEIIDGLKEDNVFLGLYKFCHIRQPFAYTNKVQAICAKFLTYLGNLPKNQQYLTTIVRCCLKGYQKFGLKESLFHISRTFRKNLAENPKKSVSDALLYLKSQKNAFEVFQEVLLTFNVALIEFAAHTLKITCPRYEEFFANLKTLDYITQRLVINQHLSEGTFVDIPKFSSLDKPTKMRLESKYTFDTLPRNINITVLEQNKAELKEAELLESESRLAEACKIYEKCLGHLETTCSLLAKKHSFLGAVRVAKKHRKDELIVRDVLPLAETYCNELINSITNKIEVYDKLIAMLVSTRQNLLQDPNVGNFERIIAKTNLNMEDAVMKETGSNTDSEVEYVDTLHSLFTLIEEVFNLKDTVREICYILLSNPKAFYRKCKTLHDSLYEFHIKIIKDVPLIWPTLNDAPEQSGNDDFVINCPYLKPPNNINLNWILPYFINK